MKKLITIALCLFTTVLAFSQQSFSPVSVDKQIQGSDTFRTFYVDGNYPAMLIAKLTQTLGTPEGENTGNLRWKNVSVPGVGQNLDLVLQDGVMIYNANTITFSVASDPADLEAKLSHDPARMHRLLIEMKKGGNNKVSSQQTEAQAKAYLEDKLFN